MASILLPFSEMKQEFERILLKNNFTADKAKSCANVFATNSLEGVYSHGVYRFKRFIDYVQKGYIKPGAEPEKINSAGALEQWTGHLGPGPLNAIFCTKRAMQVAKEFGMGCVAIGQTNHWMRGGSYAWQAVKEGFVFIGWTNTTPNMPAWGAAESKLGNNPLVFGVPFGKEAIVLDFSMTQFSYGKIESIKMEGKKLPFPGGFNTQNELSDNPEEILETMRGLPIGYWKGAGLSLLLDLIATILSAGLSTKDLGEQEAEHSISQVFIAIDLKKTHNFPTIERTIAEIIADFKDTTLIDPKLPVRFPGEQVIKIRNENLKNGIPVNKESWEAITNL